MRIFTIALAAGLALSTAAQAQTFRAENRVDVFPQAGGLFAAETNSTYGARGAWCAGADYAMDVLGARGTDRLYVRSPKAGNSGPVTFGIGPGDTTPVAVSSTSASIRTAGSNLSVDHAFQFCYDARLTVTR